MPVVTMIKKDAVVNVPIPAGFFSRIQQVLTSMVSERSQEEINEFQQMISKKNFEFPEEWMDNLFTLTVFLQSVEQEAVKQGHTYEKEISTSDN